ncbi:hypothetical protein [Plebeiibacterium marinum]|uniref:Lipoprotein n=1 Tax=Plebeiibacterium marinum TaxID=2992111 RepID=A0AAE3MFD8_9BACT|nr:hypothetical protein [Plebeiobacterium marinum]MCW3806833.1 hypothetical protein [Plebeiobacterium marinum]
MKYISFLFIASFLLLLSCQQNSHKTGKVSKNITKEIESSSNNVNDSILKNIKSDTLINKPSNIETHTIKYPINDYILHTYYPYSNFRSINRYLSIPYIVQNEKEYYYFDQYPTELIVSLIPTKIDTLEVISGTGNDVNCLDILKIQDKNEIELFYSLSINDKIIAQKGKLDTILTKRGLSSQNLRDSMYIKTTLPNWTQDVQLSNCLNSFYYLPTDSTLQKYQNIEGIKKQLLKKEKLTNYSLETLRILYNNYLNTKDVIRINNLLINDNGGYFHSGGFDKDIEEDVLLLIDSLNIIYISEENEVFKVEWLSNYSTVLGGSGILDDNYVSILDNHYVIDDWATGTTTRLFHPDMIDNDYLVVYELKLKHIDTYIQSSADIITYKKPVKKEFTQ